MAECVFVLIVRCCDWSWEQKEKDSSKEELYMVSSIKSLVNNEESGHIGWKICAGVFNEVAAADADRFAGQTTVVHGDCSSEIKAGSV